MLIEPLKASFGVRVSGIDLRTLPVNDLALVVHAAETRGTVVITGQSLTAADQLTFTAVFGRVRKLQLNPDRAASAEDGVVEVSNIGADGAVTAPDSRAARFSKGNENWHADYSYTAEGAAQSILFAIVAAGETWIADMSGAFAALAPKDQAEAGTKTAIHDLYATRARAGFPDPGEEVRASLPAVRHPLVRRHPVTGRRALYLGAHIDGIEGMGRDAARALLDRLTAHATQDRFVYRHRWHDGDVLIWDNRSTLHQARPRDPAEPRHLRRTAVAA